MMTAPRLKSLTESVFVNILLHTTQKHGAKRKVEN